MRLEIEDLKGNDREKAELVSYAKVLLNGLVVSGCIMADEENGIVKCFITNDKNELVIFCDKAQVQTLHGKVEIIDTRLE